MPVDLHCHSLFSVDGLATPEELADAARAAGVTALALTDHNTVDGLARCRARAAALGLRFIEGVEFDALWRGAAYHFVAFGMNPEDRALRRLCGRQFAQYALTFERLLPVLTRRFGVTRERLLAGLPGRYRTHPAPVLNKWFARDLLLAEGVFKSEEDARRQISEVADEAEQNVPRPWDWAAVEEVRTTVHAAGGILLLAHVAGSFRGNQRGQVALIEELLGIGLDGFELYHPANMAEPHFGELEALARQLGCAVSGGSDRHQVEARAGQSTTPCAVPDWVVETLDAALARRRGLCT